MFFVSYDGLVFRVARVLNFNSDLIYTEDGVDPLWWEHSLDLILILGTFNAQTGDFVPGFYTQDNFLHQIIPPTQPVPGSPPQTTYFGNGGLPLSAYASSPGRMSAPVIINYIKARLARPRKVLLAWSIATNPGGNGFDYIPLLESPLRTSPGRDWRDATGVGRFANDAKNGPQTNLVWAQPEQSQGAVMLRVQFQTALAYVNDGGISFTGNPGGGGDPGPTLLSNRWTMAVGRDANFYAAHRYEGQAIFRLDLMNRLNTAFSVPAIPPVNFHPADFVNQFLHPVPVNFRRSEIETEYAPDGSAATYRFLDTEMEVNQPGVAAYGASIVNVRHERNLVIPNTANVARQLRPDPYGILGPEGVRGFWDSFRSGIFGG